jgi:hypothetical protein
LLACPETGIADAPSAIPPFPVMVGALILRINADRRADPH